VKFEKQIREHAERSVRARAMGGPKKLAKRKESGLMDVRARIDYLLDAGSFRESGLFGVSYLPKMRDSTPCDGKVTGFGKLAGRRVGVVGYDFTVKGSSSSYTNNRKMAHVKDIGTRRGFPIVFLGESTGVRMPDIMGEGMGMNFEGNRFLRTREAPWAAAILGNAFGSAAWHACCADFCVMRKGAVMAVASPRVVSMSLGREVTPEELGGWQRLPAELRRGGGAVEPDLLEPGNEVLRHVTLLAELLPALRDLGEHVVEGDHLAAPPRSGWCSRSAP